MGKRIIRIFPKDFPEKLPALIGIEMNIVRTNGITLHGYLLQFDNSQIQVKDSIRRKHALVLTEIEEIIVDKTTPF